LKFDAARDRRHCSGGRLLPRLSRSRRPGSAEGRRGSDPRGGAAVSPAHAAHRQGLFGEDEQLRPARLGVGRGRLSLSADPPQHRTPVAGDAGAAPHGLGDDRPRRAAARGLPHQSLRYERAHGPAPGPRRGGPRRPSRFAVARGHGAFPRRRPRAGRGDPFLPPRLGRRHVACRRRPSRLPRRRPHCRRFLDPRPSRRQDQSDASAGDQGGRSSFSPHSPSRDGRLSTPFAGRRDEGCEVPC
jgi:hypothetical protein